jgi:hypothetical protein
MGMPLQTATVLLTGVYRNVPPKEKHKHAIGKPDFSQPRQQTSRKAVTWFQQRITGTPLPV